MTSSINIYQNRIRIGDPYTNSDTSTRVSMLFSVFDALIQRDDIGTFKPRLAESWNISRDVRGRNPRVSESNYLLFEEQESFVIPLEL